MQNKLKLSSIHVKLKKYSSDSKFRVIQHHSLNKSPSKNVPSFKTGTMRLLQPKSISPDKFYDIPAFKTKKSASFGFGIKTNFAKKQFIEPTRYKISSSFQFQKPNKIPGPSFGISRQEFYKGKFLKTSEKIGPGLYNLDSAKRKTSFYIGLKMKRNDETTSPGPGAYNVRVNQSLNDSRCSSTLKIRAPRIKTEYFQKPPLHRYDNKIPGPGAYNLNSSSSLVLLQKQKISKPKLPQCPRFKVRQPKVPAPGAYEPFSEFGE